MRTFFLSHALALLLVMAPQQIIAEGMMTETFEEPSEARWRFFTDGVMGGVSSGQAAVVRDGGDAFARMTGTVSTANNGGFIQMRKDLGDGAPPATVGVRLIVRGNDQRYFVHLRTHSGRAPWQYYQAGFDVTGGWTEVRLPLEAFAPNGGLTGGPPRGEDLTSLGIVAYGRDHQAEIDVREVGFY